MADPPPAEPAPGICESCGRPDDDLRAVHRAYVRAEGWREVREALEEERVDVVEEAERWCYSCRSQYPHRPVTP